MKTKFNNHTPEIELGVASPFTNTSIWSSTGLIETIWDTLFALAIATAIYIGVASLAGHLNDAQAVRNADVGRSKQVGMMSSVRLSPTVVPIGDQWTSQFD